MRGIVIPTVIMKINSRKCVGGWHVTRYRWTIPVAEIRSFGNCSTRVGSGGMYWSKVGNIWARMTRR